MVEKKFLVPMEKLEEYLGSIHNGKIKVVSIEELGTGKAERELKGFGYGKPYLIKFRVNGREMKNVLQTVNPGQFGHEYFSDRAQILLWQFSAFNNLPKHVRAVDVGAFTKEGTLKSLGDCEELFLLTEVVDGRLYHQDLDEIKKYKELTELDLDRCEALAEYLAEIHALKKNAPSLYIRRIRELIGHSECIMGLIDSYPPDFEFADKNCMCMIEKKCVEWRWKIKGKTHRLSQVHGDFHPWNIMFREGIDFTVLDRSRGEWGEPADDVTALSINYIFYSLQTYGKLEGPFKSLFEYFWSHYLSATEDDEILTVVQPFYAWRALVIASPIWYPNLPAEVRRKLFNFILNVLETEEFDIDHVNSYFER